MTRTSTAIATITAIATRALVAIGLDPAEAFRWGEERRRRRARDLRDPQRHRFVPSDSWWAKDICERCNRPRAHHRTVVGLAVSWLARRM